MLSGTVREKVISMRFFVAVQYFLLFPPHIAWTTEFVYTEEGLIVRELVRKEAGSESHPDSIRCSAVWVFTVLIQPSC